MLLLGISGPRPGSGSSSYTLIISLIMANVIRPIYYEAIIFSFVLVV